MNDDEILKMMENKVFVKAVAYSADGSVDHNILEFTSNKGDIFTFSHSQDCCESVSIEEIHGDLTDLLESPILIAEVVSFRPTEIESSDNIRPDKDEWGELDRTYDDSITWTFYKFATIKGSATVRWFGSSNGYYSESVDIQFDPYFINEAPEYVIKLYNDYGRRTEISDWFYKNDISSPMNEKEETLFKLTFL